MPNATHTVEAVPLFCLKCGDPRGRLGVDGSLRSNEAWYDRKGTRLMEESGLSMWMRIMNSPTRGRGPRLFPKRAAGASPFRLEDGPLVLFDLQDGGQAYIPEYRVFVVEHRKCGHQRRWREDRIADKLRADPSSISL